MPEFQVTMEITARDADHAREIMSEVMQRVEDARDSGVLDGGEAAFDEFSLKEVS